MTDTTVKYFDSTMSGAPALSGEAGKLVAVLDACLVNGFGSVTLDSLVVASDVATGSISTGHNLAMVGDTGPVIKIEGATPSGLNGEWRLASVPTANTFTFTTSGISDQTATGTITAKLAPAGWTKAYSGTNKAAYARTALAATAMLLRVDDTPTQYPTLIMYEAMSDVDTGTGPAPTSGSVPFCKSLDASTQTRLWALYSDDQAFYLCADNSNDYTWASGMFFGDPISYKSGDAYHCKLIGTGDSGNNYIQFSKFNSTTNSLFSRSYTQLGAAIVGANYSHAKTTGCGYGGQIYPNPVDNGFHAWPIECWEGTTIARGLMPGLWNPIHGSDASLTQGLLLTDLVNLPNRTLRIQKGATSFRMAFDITGPWR